MSPGQPRTSLLLWSMCSTPERRKCRPSRQSVQPLLQLPPIWRVEEAAASLMSHLTVPVWPTWFQAVVGWQSGHYSLNSEAMWSTESWCLILESSIILTVQRGSWWRLLLPSAEPTECQDNGDGNEIQNQLCKLHHRQDRGSKPETPLVPKLGQQSHYLQEIEKEQWWQPSSRTLPPCLFPLPCGAGQSSPHPVQGKETQYPAVLLEQNLATVEGHPGGMGGQRRHCSNVCTVKAGDSPLVL